MTAGSSCTGSPWAPNTKVWAAAEPAATWRANAATHTSLPNLMSLTSSRVGMAPRHYSGRRRGPGGRDIDGAAAAPNAVRSAGGHMRLEMTPARSLVDEPLRIAVGGASPGER